jgi:5'-3' exonuclease
MGIPSFFSYIIKNHGNILQKSMDITRNNIKFDRLYMDCNSILYDSYREIKSNVREIVEEQLLRITIEKIEYYIDKIRPSNTIFIAFDGVAPFAKMEQQRTRRYRSLYESTVTGNNTDEEPSLSTIEFTPGTEFMNKLSTRMKQHFNNTNSSRKYGVRNLIVATPDEPGEGEHKLYAHIREYPSQNDRVAVYGLDADLLMLSIFHLSYTPELYVFREAPAFASFYLNTKNEQGYVDESEPWFIDMGKMGRSLASDMACTSPDNHRMNDYVFMCFLLGNDFLPHFPALNIRTNGIQRLLDVYRKCIGNYQERFLLSKTTPTKIVWSEVSRFLNELAKHETEFILQEYSLRKKWDPKTVDKYRRETPEEEKKLFDDIPILFRQEEKYICPQEDYWQDRYYQRLLSTVNKNLLKEEKMDVCVNYLEGLEWVCKYYTGNCPHWRWKYNYKYPPLLKDLVRYVPTLPTQFLNTNYGYDKPFTPQTQLIYVLPPTMHQKMLPESIVQNIHNEKNIHYFLPFESKNDILKWEFKWAFCRYFWESHIETPEIPLHILNEWNKQSLTKLSHERIIEGH